MSARTATSTRPPCTTRPRRPCCAPASSQPGDQTFAVNLTSRRARIARWLLGGVRQGQSLGSLLGYRFERALHDADLDEQIDDFRRNFPAPTVPQPRANTDADTDLWARSTQAIAARNVVDGMALATTRTRCPPATGRVQPIIADVLDALDAVGDLVLAESVHQLVGGNPLRAGMAADTLGRGGDVPDTFHVLRTPHRARALTNRLAALLPEGAGPTGWPTDALARLEPAVEAWVAHLLGPAAGWTLTGTTGPASQPFELTADRLGTARSRRSWTRRAPSNPGSRRHRHRARRRARHGVRPQRTRLDRPARPGGPAPRAADHRPAAAARAPAGHRARADRRHHRRPPPAHRVRRRPRRRRPAGCGRLAALATASDEVGGPEGWLSRVRPALAEVLGAEVPLLPRLGGPAPAPRPDAGPAAVGDWLERYASVRPTARALHETLVLSGIRAGRGEAAARDPGSHRRGGRVGRRYVRRRPPPAREHAPRVARAARSPAAGPVAGLLLDEWAELLPGADRIRESTDVSPAASPRRSPS